MLFIFRGPMMFLESPPRPVFGEIDKHSPAAQWFHQLTKQLALPSKPKAILVITAHWETTDTIEINSQEQHSELYYDYYGFPAEAYEITYNPPGDIQLAERVKSLLTQAGIPSKLNPERNFDHGVFIPMKLMYPNGEIPIVSMSILDNLSPEQHLAIGKALVPLRREEILIIGSGSFVHGFHVKDEESKPFADAFIDILTKADVETREDVLLNWKEKLPFARENHPREEHLIPLHVIVGAAADDQCEYLNPNVIKTQAAFRFGN